MMDSAVHHLGGVLSAPGVFLNFFDELPVGVCIMDRTGHIMLANTAYEQLTGAARENIIGLQCLHALRCDFCLKGCPVHAGHGSRIGAFEPQKSEATIINRERRKLTVRLTIAPLLDGQGRQVGIVETVAPVTAGGEHEIPGPGTYSFGGLIGKSPQIEQVFRMVPSIAQTDSSVLITGETGTGKDMLAEAIHKASERSGGPFIKVNCGALPDTLLESELFGHAKGAFTGADQDKPGRFRLAHGGTLFLTEIGDLPLHLQVKLLSFLDDKVIYPLGSTKGAVADVRVIVATHRDLESMVRENRFRQDLFFRLNVIRLHLPPMRERGRDITLLQDHFLRRFCQRFGKNITGLSDRAAVLLDSYAYPGNVRELRNVIEYAVNFCEGEVIHVRHLPSYLRRPDAVPGPLPESTTPSPHTSVTPPLPVETPSSGFSANIGNDANWEDVERRMILDALVKSGGRKHKAAVLLGWGRSTLWRKMKTHGLD